MSDTYNVICGVLKEIGITKDGLLHFTNSVDKVKKDFVCGSVFWSNLTLVHNAIGKGFFDWMTAYHFPGLTKSKNCKTMPLCKTGFHVLHEMGLFQHPISLAFLQARYYRSPPSPHLRDRLALMERSLS